MWVPEFGVTVDYLLGAVSVLLIPVITTIADYIGQALFDRKVFQPFWTGVKRRYKAWRTKHNKITADYEFSINLDSKLSRDALRTAVSEILESIDDESEGDFEIVDQKWSEDGREVDIQATYKNGSDPYVLTLNFIPDSGGPFDTDYDPSIGSVGVNITFHFEFGKLRNSMIDLMLFAGFLRDAVNHLLPVKSITDGRFVVSPIDNDLTLDDWIKKEQFDVSLLLESEDQRSSVEFHSDKAVISSPHTDVDDKTVEYIRATLLNYYL